MNNACNKFFEYVINIGTACHLVTAAGSGVAGRHGDVSNYVERKLDGGIFTKILFSAKKYVSTVAFILAFTVLGVGLSGCDALGPVYGHSMGRTLVETVVFTRDDGELYIDIQDRNKYKLNQIVTITITLIKDQRPTDIYWSIYKFVYSGERATSKSDDFPLRYGEVESGTTVEIQPMKIQNGIYTIEGWGSRLDDKGSNTVAYRGKFSYENGTVHNFK